MRNATSFATGAASVTAFALLAAAVLLAGCDIPGLEDAVGGAGHRVPRLPRVPGDGDGAGRQLHDGIAGRGGGTPCRRSAAPGDDRGSVRRGGIRGDLREWDACAAVGNR